MSHDENPQPQAEQDEHPVRDTVKHLASDSKEAIEHASQVTKTKIEQQPTTAAAIAGAVAMAAAVTFGVLETAVGGTAAYVAYRLLRKRKQATAQ